MFSPNGRFKFWLPLSGFLFLVFREVAQCASLFCHLVNSAIVHQKGFIPGATIRVIFVANNSGCLISPSILQSKPASFLFTSRKLPGDAVDLSLTASMNLLRQSSNSCAGARLY